MDRGAWQATVHGITKNQAQLNNQHFHFSLSLAVMNSRDARKDQEHFGALARVQTGEKDGQEEWIVQIKSSYF